MSPVTTLGPRIAMPSNGPPATPRSVPVSRIDHANGGRSVIGVSILLAAELCAELGGFAAQITRGGEIVAQPRQRRAAVNGVADLRECARNPHLRVVAQRRVGHFVAQSLPRRDRVLDVFL